MVDYICIALSYKGILPINLSRISKLAKTVSCEKYDPRLTIRLKRIILYEIFGTQEKVVKMISGSLYSIMVHLRRQHYHDITHSVVMRCEVLLPHNFFCERSLSTSHKNIPIKMNVHPSALPPPSMITSLPSRSRCVRTS